MCDPAGLPVGLELVLVEPDRQTLYQLEGEQYPGDVWYGGEGVLHQQRRDTFFIGRSAMQMLLFTVWEDVTKYLVARSIATAPPRDLPKTMILSVAMSSLLSRKSKAAWASMQSPSSLGFPSDLP